VEGGKGDRGVGNTVGIKNHCMENWLNLLLKS
jgi:hypothetical protein